MPFIASASLSLGHVVFAAELPTCPAQPIRLSYLEYGALYYQARGNTGAGIDADIIAELARRSGCKFEVTTQVRARTWLEMRNKNLDMTTSALRTPEREEYAWFIPYIKVHHQVLLTSAAMHAITLEQATRIPSLRLGIVRGYHYTPFYDQVVANWNRQGRVAEFSDESTLMSALKRGDIAVTFSYPLVYRHYLNDEDMQKLKITDWEPDSTPNLGNLMLAKHHFSEAETEKWRNLVNAMYQDGTMRKIFSNYIGSEEVRAHMLIK